MNVLLTSAGRRSSLLAAFREAAARRGGRVLAGDMDGLAPTLFQADVAVPLPAVLSSQFVPALLDIVRAHGIGLVVPTIDTELPVLAASRGSFATRGCTVLVSEPELIRITGDKWETVQVFGGRGVTVPTSWLPGQADATSLPLRLFIKPRRGSASQHAYPVRRDRLPDLLPLVPDPIIQEELLGPEITVDALLGLDGRLLHYVPRLRMRTVGGESIQGATLPDTDLRDWLQQVLAIVAEKGGRGPITLQAFITAAGPVLTEINPRFGGGFPLTQAAGGHYPEWILAMAAGAQVQPCLGAYRHPLFMTRYYVEHFVEQPRWR